MRVAFNADFVQMDNRNVAAALVHRVPPFARHLQTYAPLILPRIRCRSRGYEIAVIDDDGNPVTKSINFDELAHVLGSLLRNISASLEPV